MVLLMLVAGCFAPPPPPSDEPPTTERPNATPYVSNGAEMIFQQVQPDHESTLLNDSDGFTSRYSVQIMDPRMDSGNQTMISTYQIDLNNTERVFTSNLTDPAVDAYQNSLLYYEQVGTNSTVTPISETNTTAINLSTASANSSLIRVGMNSIDYSLSDVKYQGGQEISTYTGSQSVSNYALSELFPEEMAYSPGNLQVSDESISSTVTMTKDGLMKKFTFEYSATAFIDGAGQEYSVVVTYQIGQTGAVNVTQPSWTENMSTTNA